MAGNEELARRAVRGQQEAGAVRPHLQARPCVAREGAARADPRAGPRGSSIPTIICGTCRAIATGSTTCWPTSTPGTRWWRPSSTNATSMYRARGPVEMKPVGEVEFAAGVAAMSDSGIYGPDADLRRHRGPCRPHAGRSRGAGARGRDHRRRRPLQAACAMAPPGTPTRSSATATSPRAPGVLSQRRLPRRLGAAVRARPVARCLDLPSPARRA